MQKAEKNQKSGPDQEADKKSTPQENLLETSAKSESSAQSQPSSTSTHHFKPDEMDTNHSKTEPPKPAKSSRPHKFSWAKKHKAHPVERAHTSDGAFRAAVIALLILSFCAAGGALGLSIINYHQDHQTITWGGGVDGNSANFTEGSIAEVASKVAPGVVSIVTETRTTGWFGQSSTSTSAGTGMIVTKDGYVLTNKHVVDGANSIKVVLDNGETYDKITLVGTDPLNDVAFLKINDVNDLPTVTLGDSKTITAGQQVIAIGNALGQYQNTITSGIVSGTGRSLTAYASDYSSAENLSDMIQTDAAINAGNSGGPLVNAAGQVIGINTATTSEADGIGFAIPISSVKGMLNNIIKNQAADRSYMGVYYINITPDIAVTYDLPVTSGAYISNSGNLDSVIKDGPGDKAGLKDKDIIIKINGVSVGKAGTVSSLIGEYMPGDTIQITVLRDGKEKNINLTLGTYGSNNRQKS